MRNVTPIKNMQICFYYFGYLMLVFIVRCMHYVLCIALSHKRAIWDLMLTYILNAESSLFLTGILNPPVNINKYIKGHIPFTLMFSENQIIGVVSRELNSQRQCIIYAGSRSSNFGHPIYLSLRVKFLVTRLNNQK
jgi:hypothetical protein